MSCPRQQPRRNEAAAAPCPESGQENVFPVGKLIQTGHKQHTRVHMQVRLRLGDVNTYIHRPNLTPVLENYKSLWVRCRDLFLPLQGVTEVQWVLLILTI